MGSNMKTRTGIVITCAQCHCEFYRKPSDSGAKFCSRRCWKDFTREKRMSTCASCGNLFTADYTRKNKNPQLCCSRECNTRLRRLEREKKYKEFFDNNISGKRFGRWTALEVGIPYRGKGIMWNCRCDCGEVQPVFAFLVSSGKSQSCGCKRGDHNRNKYLKTIQSLIGTRVGMLSIVGQAPKQRNGDNLLNCICDCGSNTFATTHQLTSGKKTSCGCTRFLSGRKARNWQGHGLISKKFWGQIKRSAEKRNYELSIGIEDAWSLLVSQNYKCAYTGIELTIEFSKRNASLDRIDNKLGYIKGNVQWVDKRINNMKGVLPQKDFIELCRLVSSHSICEETNSSR